MLGIALPARASLIQYLPKLEELRAAAENVSRIGHVDVIHEVSEDFEPYHNEIAVCHLAHPFPASFVTPEGERTLINQIGTWAGKGSENGLSCRIALGRIVSSWTLLDVV